MMRANAEADKQTTKAHLRKEIQRLLGLVKEGGHLREANEELKRSWNDAEARASQSMQECRQAQSNLTAVTTRCQELEKELEHLKATTAGEIRGLSKALSIAVGAEKASPFASIISDILGGLRDTSGE